jgi:uncharacterized protein YcbX
MSSSLQATITGLHVYPVKSCKGISLAEAKLTVRGLAHDREWLVVDLEGMFLTQRTLPCMALVETALTADSLRLSAPGMPEVLEVPLALRDLPRRRVRVWNYECEAFDEGDAAAAWLSAALDKAVRLVRFDPTLRRLSSHDWTGGVDAENRFSDDYPVLVISEESLENLNQRLDFPVPMDRFRPNIIVRGIGAFGEDHFNVLNAEGFAIRLVKPCVRCIITATDQATASVGKEPLRTLATYRRDPALKGVTFGMNGIMTGGPGAVLKLGTRLNASTTSPQSAA